jgi:hypothetical protein
VLWCELVLGYFNEIGYLLFQVGLEYLIAYLLHHGRDFLFADVDAELCEFVGCLVHKNSAQMYNEAYSYIRFKMICSSVILKSKAIISFYRFSPISTRTRLFAVGVPC